MSALDPVAAWVDLFDLTDHPPTDEELETFGQAIEQAVRARMAAEILAASPVDDMGTESGIAWAGGWGRGIARAARIAEGKQP